MKAIGAFSTSLPTSCLILIPLWWRWFLYFFENKDYPTLQGKAFEVIDYNGLVAEKEHTHHSLCGRISIPDFKHDRTTRDPISTSGAAAVILEETRSSFYTVAFNFESDILTLMFALFKALPFANTFEPRGTSIMIWDWIRSSRSQNNNQRCIYKLEVSAFLQTTPCYRMLK